MRGRTAAAILAASAKVPQSGTLALSSVWHLALWHSALFVTWHFGTQICLALGTLTLTSVMNMPLCHSVVSVILPLVTQLFLLFRSMILRSALTFSIILTS